MHPQEKRRTIRLHVSRARESWFYYAPLYAVLSTGVRGGFFLAALTLRALPTSTEFFKFPRNAAELGYPDDERFLPTVADPFFIGEYLGADDTDLAVQSSINAAFDGILGLAGALLVINAVVLWGSHRGRRPFRNPSWSGSLREKAVILGVAFLVLLELGAWCALLGISYSVIDVWLDSPATIRYLDWLAKVLPHRADLDARHRILYPLLHVLQAAVAVMALEVLVRVLHLSAARILQGKWHSSSLPEPGRILAEPEDRSHGVLAEGFRRLRDKARLDWEKWWQEQAARRHAPTTAQPLAATSFPASLPKMRLDDNLAYWKKAPYRDNTYTGLGAQIALGIGVSGVLVQFAILGVLLYIFWDSQDRCSGVCTLTWIAPAYTVLFVGGMVSLVRSRVPLGMRVVGPVTVAWVLKGLWAVGAGLNPAAFWAVMELADREEVDQQTAVHTQAVMVLYGIASLGVVIVTGGVLLLPTKTTWK